jgi:hypothetical protein
VGLRRFLVERVVVSALAEGADRSRLLFNLGLRRTGIVPPRRADPPIRIRGIRAMELKGSAT